jgi:hypothetical protein
MRKRKSQQHREVDSQATDRNTTEEPLLRIDQLEPRLTPDGWGGHPNNNPPGGQVGWGC